MRLVVVGAEDVAGRITQSSGLHVVVYRDRTMAAAPAELSRPGQGGPDIGDARVHGGPGAVPVGGADAAADAALLPVLTMR